MAYIALYRKWRPKTFEDVVGQSHITTTLQKGIDTDKVAHAYLFSGPRGTGKTSTAKIFARALNCVHGPTSHPCNECEICRHILQGESLDVVEIDAASNRSIEDIRTLRETIKFMPAEGNKKIYIIDEVHMLTTEAFNALLKTLEEPPSHVVFILATTEPERIPMTILSRCQRYEFRRITSADIAARLMYIAEQEQVGLTKGAAHILAVQADGGMRDALSMFDQCISNADGSVDEASVRSLLGLMGRDWLFSLSEAVFGGQGGAVIKAVDDVSAMGKEPQVILTELLEHIRALMLYQADPQTDTLAAYADSLPQLAEQAAGVTADRVFAVLGILQQAVLTAKTSPFPRIAVEMGLLMASRAAVPAEFSAAVPNGVAERLTRLEQAVFQGKTENIAVPEKKVAPVFVPDDGGQPFIGESLSAAAEAGEVHTAVPAAPEDIRPEKKDFPASAPEAAVPETSYQHIWRQMCDILMNKMKKPGVCSCVRTGRVVYIGGGEAVVAYKTEFLVKRANREDYYRFVDKALESILGRPCHMKGYAEGAPELAEYEKKNRLSVPAETTSQLTVPAPDGADALRGDEGIPPVLRPATRDDMTPAERAVLDPLLKTVGECNIYIEDKK